MRKAVILTSCCLFASLVIAQQEMNNDSVIKLCKAGLSDDVTVSTIKASTGTYDISTNGLLTLKSAGVSDRVISAIVLKASGATAVSPAPTVATNPIGANPDDPAAPHEAGIYADSEIPSDHKRVMLEPSVYSQGKTGGLFTSAMTYGIAKAKVKAVIRGAHSNARVADPQAVFYFYFEQQGAGLSNANGIFGGTSTPNEFTLLRLDVKDSTRETMIGKFSAWGASGGIDDKAVVPFTYTKLRPGVYKVTLSAPLKPGEYGFVAPSATTVITPYGGAAGATNRIFDFGFAMK